METGFLSELAEQARARWGVPGLAAGVLAAGETATVVSGLADVEAGRAVEPGTRFRVASVTKSFTAALAERVLDLDAPLETPAGPRTPRALLSHCAGLRCERGRDGAIRPHGGPEGLFVYANSGYWLVAEAIERATGLTFAEALRRRLLAPLGLGETGFGEPDAAGYEPVAPGALEHRRFPHPYPPGRSPSGGLVSTVGNLLRYAAARLDDLPEPVVETPEGAYGLGWWFAERGDATLVSHTGSAVGFQSLLLLVPERRFAFAALTNSARGRAAIRPLAGAALTRLAGLPRREPGFVDLPARALAALAGRYVDEDAEVVVAARDGGLVLEVRERDPFAGELVAEPPFVARPVGPRTFEVVEGEAAGDRLDFPGEGLLRMGSLLARAER